MHNALISLAKETSSDKRRELLGHVADLFMNGADHHSDEELTLFNGVLTRLLSLVEDDGKAEISEKLAHVDQTPHDLVVRLANEDITVARYMLQYSSVLTRDDLLKLAKVKGQEHLLAISKRDTLDEPLTDVLLERGEQPVRRSVAANPGARFSGWGSRFLVKLAEKDEVLRESLAMRGDLAPEHYDRVFALMPKQQGEKLRALHKDNEGLVDALLREATDVVTRSKMDRTRSRLDTKVTVKDIRHQRKSLNMAVMELLLSSKLLDLSYLLSDMTGLDQKYVINAFLHPQIDAAALIFKVLEIGENEFGTFCKVRGNLLKLPAKTAEGWLSDYKVLAQADCERAFRFIKVRMKAIEQSQEPG